MADGRGAKSLAAIVAGSTWGTAVQAGAGDGFIPRSESITGGKEVIPDRSLQGKVWGTVPFIGTEMHRGTIPMDLRYGANVAKFLAYIMGTAGSPTEVEAALEYTHALAIADRLAKFFTLAIRKGDIGVWEYASAMVTRLTIEITGRGPATMEAELLISSCLDDDSGTNDTTSIASVTIPAPLRPVFIGDARFRLNGQAAGALGAGDVLKPSLLRITIDRKLSEDFLADATLGNVLSQPVETEDPEVMLEMRFPEYLAATYRSLVDDGTEKKADLLLTSSAAPLTGAASGLYHEYDFDFPRLIGVERPDNAASGPGRIEDGIVFKAIEPSAAPTGMTTTKPFACTVRNQISSDLLA